MYKYLVINCPYKSLLYSQYIQNKSVEPLFAYSFIRGSGMTLHTRINNECPRRYAHRCEAQRKIHTKGHLPLSCFGCVKISGFQITKTSANKRLLLCLLTHPAYNRHIHGMDSHRKSKSYHTKKQIKSFLSECFIGVWLKTNSYLMIMGIIGRLRGEVEGVFLIVGLVS